MNLVIDNENCDINLVNLILHAVHQFKSVLIEYISRVSDMHVEQSLRMHREEPGRIKEETQK